MKFRNLFTLSLLLIILHLFFWWLYADVLSCDSLQRKKAALFKTERNRQASIWIMGDSHPMMALNPAFIPGSFNQGATSEYFFLTLLKLKAMLSESAPPGFLILPLDMHSFSAQGNALLLNHELDDVFWSQLVDPLEMRHSGLPSAWMRWYLSARFFPYAGQYYRLVASLKKESYQLDSSGFVPAEEDFSTLSQANRQHTAETRFRAHFEKYPPLDSLQMAAFSEIISLCNSKNIRLILLSYPISDEYRRCAENQLELKSVKSLTDSIKARHCHLDFSRFFSGKPGFFSDPDHLNRRGAAVLSRRLNAALDSIRKIPVEAPPGI
jgi:hypothetical protein